MNTSNSSEYSISDLFPSGKIPWSDLSLAFVLTAVIYLFLTYTLLGDEDELPARFIVPIPEQCKPDWEGEVLEEPSIKVCSSKVNC